MLLDSPVLQKLLAEREAETHRKSILIVLNARFGPLPEDLKTALQTIEDASKLDEFLESAATCPDLGAFRARLQT